PLGRGLRFRPFPLGGGAGGWPPAKPLLGLRVSAAGSSEPPGLTRALVRTATHFAIVYLGASVLMWAAYSDPEAWWLGLVAGLVSLLASLLLLSTMRERNGYRGPHEVLS